MSTTVSAESTLESGFVAKLDAFLVERTGMRGPLIPVLQFAQEELGYLPEDALRLIARRLDLSYSEVAGVVTFYSFFSTVPRGQYVIRVCLGTACYVRGGNEVLTAFKRELGIEVGMTTDDRLFSLDVGRCFGACGLAPVVVINDDVHQRVKPSAVRSLIDSYRAEEATQ